MKAIVNFLSSSRSFWILLQILAWAGTLLRLVLGWVQNPTNSIISEMSRHWENGNLATFVEPPSFMQGVDPLIYQVFILVLRFFTQDNAILIGLLIGLLSAATPWLYYLAARKFGLAPLASMLVLVFLVWNPSLITLYWYFISESLVTTLIGAGLLAAANYQANPGIEKFLLAVFAWTLAAMTNAVALPLGALVIALLWWQKSLRWKDLGLAVGLVLLVIMPNTIRSWSILGYPAPFGSNWMSRIQYASQANSVRVEFTDGQGKVQSRTFKSPNLASARRVLSPLSQWELAASADTSTTVVKIRKANGLTDWMAALRDVKDSKERFTTRWVGNLIYLATAPSWPEPYQDASFMGYALNLQRWIWGPLLLACGLVSLVSIGVGSRDLLVISSFAVCVWLVTQNTSFIEGRNRKPIEPLLVIGLAWMVTRRPWVAASKSEIETESSQALAPNLDDLPATAVQS